MTTSTTPPARSAARVRLYAPARRERLTLAAATVALLLVLGALQPNVLSLGNLENILVQASYMMVFATAQAIVILTRGLDLSLGVTVSLASVCAALAMTHFADHAVAAPALGVAAGLGAALAVGLFNGVCIAWTRISPFVVTLGTMNIVLTLSSTVSGGFPVAPLPAGFAALATAQVAGVPVQLPIVAVTLGALAWLMSRTVFGRSLTLIGANPAAARVAGVRVKLTLLLGYLLCGALVAIGALLLTARTGSGEPNLGGNLALQSIAAAVLGGIRLQGGEGDVLAPVLGALFVTILGNGMDLLHLNGFLQQILLGAIIVAALGLDRFRAHARLGAFLQRFIRRTQS
ncbi:ABC transporter permease [Paraburkholderia acidisoli]|uniref:ABC transporter permease n=1 Tax=Paraburkholderia acidisoli TaxID=2571748 RepID=A0A7Z2GMH7_9BURK|nr:ABC transporter permease [Paraburkholderia acidisoli]QGZ64274.1 ABC transporter permease [Paraburkholderia acidisoli]